MSFVDLHLHTRYSDGSWTPAELCRAAANLKLVAIAITDHDTLDAVPEALAAAAALGLEVIPGVEITCRVDVREIHLLGYLPGNAWQNRELQIVLDHSKRIRAQRIDEIVARINEHGVDLTSAEVFACSECGTIGRPHVAMALVKRGIVKSNEEAFERFLKRGKPGFVDRYRMPSSEAIRLVRRAGGVAVLAHPALNRVDDQIANLVEQGIDGLEVWHSRQTPSQSERYRLLTQRYGLIATGGSDCHGTVRGKTTLGTVPVPYESLLAIQERIKSRA